MGEILKDSYRKRNEFWHTISLLVTVKTILPEEENNSFSGSIFME